jgi:cyanophycinase
LIAGNSAGATIMGSYLVRGHPSEDNSILMHPGYEREFGYLTTTAIDQHVRARGRKNDLAEVVAAHRELPGIGVDERTAAIVQQNPMRVIGAGHVFITNGAVHDGKRYYRLSAGTGFDLADGSVLCLTVRREFHDHAPESEPHWADRPTG